MTHFEIEIRFRIIHDKFKNVKNVIDMIVIRFIVYVLMSRVNLTVENLECYEG